MDFKLNNLSLYLYDNYNFKHNELVKELEVGDSSSSYIHDIRTRLNDGKNKKDIPFGVGFIVGLKDEFIGYVFISKRIKDEIFLEYSLINEFRGKGYGKLVLSEVSDYLFTNYNIKSITLDIEPSNIPSIMTAVSVGFDVLEDDYLERNMNGKILYRMDNYKYENKRKK